MGLSTVLVANRGEVAVRVLRTAADLGLRTVAVHAEDDADGAHVALANAAYPLAGSGPAAYLDADGLLAAAADAGADAVHPGWGFLAESADFAAACAAAGLTFVGPTPDQLRTFGDKAATRALAARVGVPLLESGPPERAVELLDRHGAVMVKARFGGGGRGMRVVTDPAELPAALERCASEARAAFGRAELDVEAYLAGARHVEVQVVGDGTAVAVLGDRDCSIQRRHQKLVELAPAPHLADDLRAGLAGAARMLGAAVGLVGLATVEFLVAGQAWHLLEINPRLQVEHTVTEEVTGLDLVAVQLRVAQGASLADLGLDGGPAGGREPVGCAVQLRVNAETVRADGQVRPSSGTLEAFVPPTGPGVRVDTHAHPGHELGVRYDPLLAKVVVRAADPAGLLARARRALAGFEIRGPATNLGLLRALLDRDGVLDGVDTGWLGAQLPGLVGPEDAPPDPPAGVSAAVVAPLRGTVVEVTAAEGASVRRGEALVVLEAMKMEHLVTAPADGRVARVAVRPGGLVDEGDVLVELAPAEGAAGAAAADAAPDLDALPDSLVEVLDRHRIGLDEARPEAARRRHARGQRTARENVADLCDPGTFLEYGPLIVAAQRGRRDLDELRSRTPADGLVGGLGRVGGQQCVVLAYDYTVLAGTQGYFNHKKTDRLLAVAERRGLPVVLFAEGGGGRPGDTDVAATAASWLDIGTFTALARLSGQVPVVGIVAGRCFAGNAALLGICDVIVATRDSSIGMAGPAMIEGGGLGEFAPDQIGPPSVQGPNGVIDVLVDDEEQAVAVAREYLALVGGAHRDGWQAADQRILRHLVPENRRRVYDVRGVVAALADTGSVLELRAQFGVGVLTALVRVEGRPLGLVANNPHHLGGAIDAPAADKLARFLQLCEASGLPVVSLCDTPGFMVGPASETTATVRHFGRLFVLGANLTVPLCVVVLRKAYGLGAQSMAGGGLHVPVATVAWPTAEVGAMGLEGAVRLGHRRELDAIADPAARRAEFDRLVDEAYAAGTAMNAASVFELDDVIDPALTRRWVLEALAGDPEPRDPRRGPFVDTW